MNEEELRKLRNDMMVARLSLDVANLLLSSSLSESEVKQLIAIDTEYRSKVLEVCGNKLDIAKYYTGD